MTQFLGFLVMFFFFGFFPCVRYLDHMLDQLNSHGQLRVSVQASQTPAGELLLNFGVPKNDHHCFILVALIFDPDVARRVCSWKPQFLGSV